jgi:hypothetical protein
MGSLLDDDATRVLGRVRQVLQDGTIEAVSDTAVQELLLAAVRLYSAKRDAGTRLAAFPGPEEVTATDVAITCVGMTKVVNLELFELALWAGWSNV